MSIFLTIFSLRMPILEHFWSPILYHLCLPKCFLPFVPKFVPSKIFALQNALYHSCLPTICAVQPFVPSNHLCLPTICAFQPFVPSKMLFTICAFQKLYLPKCVPSKMCAFQNWHLPKYFVSCVPSNLVPSKICAFQKCFVPFVPSKMPTFNIVCLEPHFCLCLENAYFYSFWAIF